MNKIFAYLVLGMVLAAFSETASAISAICRQATQLGIPQCAGNAACVAQIQANHPECFGASSSTATSSQQINSTVNQQMLVISRAVGMRIMARKIRSGDATGDSGQSFGMAAGNPAAQWNFWGSANTDNNSYERGNYVDQFNTTRNNKASIDVTNLMLGGDYQLSPTMTGGLSVAFDSSSGSAESFAANISNGIASQSTNGYTIAPYIGWQIDQNWFLDATLGMGNVNMSSDGAKGRSDRLFYGANLNYVTWKDSWQLTGRGSLLHGEERSGNLTAVNGALMLGTAVTNKVDQLRLEAQAGYWMNDSMMPYLSIGYSDDIGRSTTLGAAAQFASEIGRNALLWTAGVNFFSLKNSITGGIAFNQVTGRTHARNHTLMANINFRY